jgi:hypothetical protein
MVASISKLTHIAGRLYRRRDVPDGYGDDAFDDIVESGEMQGDAGVDADHLQMLFLSLSLFDCFAGSKVAKVTSQGFPYSFMLDKARDRLDQ